MEQRAVDVHARGAEAQRVQQGGAVAGADRELSREAPGVVEHGPMGLDDPLRPPGRPRRVDEDRAVVRRTIGDGGTRAASVASVADPVHAIRADDRNRRPDKVRRQLGVPLGSDERADPGIPADVPESCCRIGRIQGHVCEAGPEHPEVPRRSHRRPGPATARRAAYPAGRAGRPGRRSPWRARPAPGSWSPRRARWTAVRSGWAPATARKASSSSSTRGSSPSVAGGSEDDRVTWAVTPAARAPRAGRRPPRCRSRSRSLRLSAPAGTSGRPGTLPSARGPSG